MCAWFPVCLWRLLCSDAVPSLHLPLPHSVFSSLTSFFHHLFIFSSSISCPILAFFLPFFFSPSLSSRLPLCAYLHRGPWEICAPLSVFQFSGVIPDKICSIRNVTWCSAGRWAPADNRDELCGFSHKSPVKLRRSD